MREEKATWGIATGPSNNKTWMSTPFENPGMATYKFSSKALGEDFLKKLKKEEGTYVPSDARVEKMA